MFFANLSRKKNYSDHKNYWKKLYTSLPGDLIIPGEKHRGTDKISLRICEIETIDLPKETLEFIRSVSRDYATSIFITLQATLKSYLFQITGQKDIVIGTQVFGRDHLKDLENQIGFYAKMNLLRTVLDEGDSFEDCIKKVIKSNEDMQTYTAFTLLDAIEEMLPAGQHVTGTFWKLTAQYQDINGFLNKSPLTNAIPNNLFKIYSIPRPGQNKIHNVDLKLNFIKATEKIILEIIYNVDLYDVEVIKDFLSGYVNHVKNICTAAALDTVN
jgi:non-ribosomal peptide synthetase component F